MHRLLLTALAALLLAGPALGWSKGGHILVASVAMQGLGPHAKAAVAGLVTNGDLAGVSTWADDVRSLQRHDPHTPAYINTDPDALAFLPNDPHILQPDWHFTDIPIGAKKWTKGTADDVVTLIRRCTHVLQDNPDSGEIITKRQAIRFLVHYVGDVHQPLHASSGFWGINSAGKATLRAPNLTSGAFDDRGGNELYYTKTLVYHHYWDDDQVAHSEKRFADRNAYVNHLVGLNVTPPASGWTLPGSLDAMPAGWATDSHLLANQLYIAIEAAGPKKIRVEDSHHPGQMKDALQMFTISPQYRKDHDAVVDQQLAAGGMHLAALLNDIWPSP